MNGTEWGSTTKHHTIVAELILSTPSALTFHGPRFVTTVLVSHPLHTNNMLPSIEVLCQHYSPASVARLIITFTTIQLLSLSYHVTHSRSFTCIEWVSNKLAVPMFRV
jgi:hypothetical protein